ncbi:rod shape-determining protein MreD [Salinibacillus kushneri]|uniref:Rod shape-determining protein MreD n=1 Tax=Salinibacillus kushneri TaxID=237682 RepID=A0A1I0JFS6_9BACI|nr:rod shape-determining protein MreD [Salinibacillus kushneri]SEU08837.1 rod shape-determining protein MreD [Salinibacillus kushneri]
MKHLFLPLILVILLVLESTATALIPEQWLLADIQPIPHWMLLFTILIAIFYDQDHTMYSLLYAIIFGFLFDFTYTDVLGVYMFTYGLTLFMILGLKKLLHPNFVVTLLLSLVGMCFADHLIYLMYFMVGYADVTWTTYLQERLLPTILTNSLFLLIVYPIFRQRLEKWADEQFST